VNEPIRPSPGAIVFVDLDGYLDAVSNLTAEQEWREAQPLFGMFASVGQEFGFSLDRTFGDGFLFSQPGVPDLALLRKSVEFLIKLRDASNRQFKATIVGGEFIRTVDRSETIICGPIANLAGKRLAQLKKQTIFCSWPRSTELLRPITLASLSQRRPNWAQASCRLDELEHLPTRIRSSETDVEPARDQPDTQAFSSDVKRVILETIRLADDKAKAAFAVAAAIIVYQFESSSWIDHFRDFGPAIDWIRFSLWLASVTAFIICATLSFFVLQPRTNESHSGLAFWGSIARQKSTDGYVRELLSSSSERLQRETAAHNFDLACVSQDKFRALKRCILALQIGASLTLVYFIVAWICSQ